MDYKVLILLAMYLLIIVPAIGDRLNGSPSSGYWNSMIMGTMIHGIAVYLAMICWVLWSVWMWVTE